MSAELEAHVADKDFQRALLRFAAYKNKGVGEIVKAQARLMCVNLAHNTQPYGADKVAEFKGKNAVRSDVARVFIGSDRVREIARIGAQRGGDVSRRLLAAIDSRNNEGVRTAWQELTGRAAVVGTKPDKGWHQSQRDKRGRVRRGARPMIVMSETALRSYTISREKLVGFAKSGWATCARLIGGTRGIPGWVSRNRGPGAVADRTSDSDNPRVMLTNNVRYIGQVLPPAEVSKALSIQTEKMQTALRIQFEKEAKASGF